MAGAARRDGVSVRSDSPDSGSPGKRASLEELMKKKNEEAKEELLESGEVEVEEEVVDTEYKRYFLSRLPPSRRLYRDPLQEQVVRVADPAAKVMHLYYKNLLYGRARRRAQEYLEHPEENRWLKEGTAGKWYRGQKEEDDDYGEEEEEIEKIEIRYQDEDMGEGEEEEKEAPWDLHDYTDIRATNFIGRLRKKDPRQRVPGLYAPVGRTKWSEENFRPGGLLDNQRCLGIALGHSRSDVVLPRFSDASAPFERRALIGIAHQPRLKALTQTYALG